MKVAVFKIITFFLILSGSFSSCEEKMNNEPEYVWERDLKAIIGKWKLVKVDIGFYNPITYDYSQSAINYEFKENNVLVILGNIDKIDTYQGHEIGNHVYIMGPDPNTMGPFSIPYPYAIRIDSLTYHYHLSSDMELEVSRIDEDNSYVYNLVKAK